MVWWHAVTLSILSEANAALDWSRDYTENRHMLLCNKYELV